MKYRVEVKRLVDGAKVFHGGVGAKTAAFLRRYYRRKGGHVVRVVRVAAALVALAVAGCASVPSEDEGGYWSQFRCEGDCDEGSGCPYCCGE